MVELIKHGVYLIDGAEIRTDANGMPSADEARENTITYGILRSHDVDGSKGKKMRIRFDAMMSHDITYVGIIQTARASGLDKFPLPYAMTNCHNSLCAVGGTINEDDHVFGLSAAKKYGGIYVPANQAVIHQYAREAMVKCGNMILGSDSHTRYGSLGNMGVGEGGGELVKQLLKNTWDINAPEVVLVWLEGKPRKGVGPHDVAISLVKATFESGFVKNKVLEFAGPGVKELPIDFRNGIDIMTTETTCLSSIWVTDDEVKHHYEIHKRPQDYRELKPGKVAYYDAMIKIDLSTQESMIALPFHPSNAYTIHELQENPVEILKAVEEDAPVAEATETLYNAMNENGRINYFWQIASAALVEQLYVINQNSDKFLSVFDDKAASDVTFRIVLILDAVNRLIDYDPEIKPVADALASLESLNAMDLNDLKKQVAESKEKIDAARKALIK